MGAVTADEFNSIRVVTRFCVRTFPLLFCTVAVFGRRALQHLFRTCLWN
jgi:hypothetical protein